MKRVLSILMTISMIFMLMVPVQATEEVIVTVESVAEAVEIGEEVTLGVTIENNTGFTDFGWEIVFDSECLELVDFENEPSMGGFTANPATAKVSAAQTNPYTENGKFFDIKFRVKENAPSGETTISVVEQEGTGLYNGADGVTVCYVDGIITIASTPSGSLSDQALIEGPSTVTMGDRNVKYTVSLYTNKEDIYYSTIYVKYPKELVLAGEPSARNFDDVSLGKITTDGDFNIAEIICIYSYDGNTMPDKTIVNAFDLYFDVSENAELKDITIEITPDSKLMNESDYSFSDFVNQTVKINPKLVESIEINGPTTIDRSSQYTATILPDYATNKTVKWSVNDETIATISEDGILTPIKTGSVTVIATALDGSGVYDEMEVEVIKYAPIASITTDGSWVEKFEDGKTECVIYVGEERTSFSVSAKYTKGTLKINDSTLLSGRTKTISLTQDETLITIKRTNVDGNTDITYTLTVIKSGESFITDIEKTDKGYSFDITLNEDEIDSFETATVMVALYDDSDNRMLLDLVRVPVIKGTPTLTATVETNKTSQYAKIMLWGGTNPFNPLCIAKEMPIQ